MRVTRFTFNPFQENTWVLDDGSHAIVVDPGCCDAKERQVLGHWLKKNALTPVRVVLTHAHIDHVLGCAWMHEAYGLRPELSREDLPLLEAAPRQGDLYGVPCEPSPAPATFLQEGDRIKLGKEELRIIAVPGHSRGHIALFHPDQHFVVSGDVLFQRSIGRTDLPGGDMDTLLASIREKLFPLGDEVVVHSGHGPDTTIGEERRLNPFLR